MDEEDKIEKCYACSQPLTHSSSIRCSICHAWQKWRRYTGDLTILSVVTIFSIILGVLEVTNKLNEKGVSDNKIVKASKDADLAITYELQRLEQGLVENKSDTNKLKGIIKTQQEVLVFQQKSISEMTNVIANKGFD